MRDTGDHAGEQAAVCCDLSGRSGRRVVCKVIFFATETAATAVGNRTKVERVQAKLRARAHGKNIADDPADAGGRALKWFDRARMIVAFDLECDRPPVADVDHTCVFFAGFDENIRSGRWKFSQLLPRIFIGAMLAPHDGENAELGEIRFAAKNLSNAFEFLRCQAMFRYQFRCDYWIDSRCLAGHRHVTLMNLQARSIAQ